MNVQVLNPQGRSASQHWQRAVLLAFALLLAACTGPGTIGGAIKAYEAVAPQVKLGQSKDEVLAILQPTQAELSSRQAKASESFMEGEVLKEVYFFRSRSFNDGLVTDDEFTPYVFQDGVLVAIGWTAIGGPKTQAQQRDNDDFHFHGRVFHY